MRAGVAGMTGRIGAVRSMACCGFRVDCQHQRPVRWVNIEADHIADLVHKLRVGGQLPGLRGVRLGANPRLIRDTVDCDIPIAAAIDRVDRCVSCPGVSPSVLVITRSTL